jgi:FkbM family methyltransferase
VGLLKKNPEDKEVLMALGQICAREGQNHDAVLFYRRVLTLEPGNADARLGIEQLPGEIQAENDIQDGASGKGASASPSAIIETEVELGSRRNAVQIPEQETFRITAIFDQNEYGILEKRRHQGVFTIFDVGANVGLFALRMQMEHPHSRIHCFEPGPFAQQLLAANVGHFEETIIHNHGLFNREMETELHVHRYNTGQNSIRFASRHHGDTVTIQLKDAGTQFDALGLDYLDVLKIDTEGCEVEILESLDGRLEKVDYVLLEYHCEQDRRRIDQLLSRFHLFGAQAVAPGVGTVKYVHPSLVY